MNKKAFFICGDNLLLPSEVSDSEFAGGLSAELAEIFGEYSMFKFPSLDKPDSAVNVVSIDPKINIPENWKKIPVRQTLAMIIAEAGYSYDILRACHIAQWRRESVYCGSCGAKNTDAEKQTQRLCSSCGRSEFPRICPAIIVIITDEKNRILLAHNKRFRSGMYSHISGFNEAGETLEETVSREVKEEVNIEVKDITYIRSQPWPFPNSLMIGFKASYLSGTIKPDGEEIEDVNWFTKNNLPELPGEGSLSRFLINDWQKT
ncbi:MAG: NAD(+) diphosphatase [Treponema sp.]|nr:NAD(+) diphosphatase [Treponema sp.]